MVRRITLLFLLCFGLHSAVHAATVRDTVTIIMPYGTDTTCPGIQLNFSAHHSNATDTVVAYHWYTDNLYTGVSIDSFHTTALADGDSVYCWLVFRDGAGSLDSAKSNTIIIHRSGSIAPRVAISLISGSNPYCAGSPLTFLALPVNGGDTTLYQWFINDTAVTGEDSITFTRVFNAGDSVSCQMISNSTCSAPFNDTAMSPDIIVIHDSLTAVVTLTASRNPICAGALDTFTASVSGAGAGSRLAWYVDSTLIPSVLGPVYITGSLHDHDLVYCILTAPDPCVINHSTVSVPPITMTVISLAPTSVSTILSEGNNPGCLDSTVTFTGIDLNFGTAPVFTWYVNGIEVLTGSNVLTRYYLNHDIVTYKVYATDGGCYTHDTVISAGVVMLRDSTPVTPLLSLIDDQLVVNNGGSYKWYLDSGLIAGAVSHIFHPTVLGNYFVIKDSANCPSLPSNVIYIALTSVKNVNKSMVRIYPNPATSVINLDFGSVMERVDVAVVNISGQAMLHEEVKGVSRHETDMSGLPAGNYFITLTDQDGNKGTFKITVVK